MKKKLLCAVAIAAGFMFTEAKAQSFSVGPRLGLNFSKVVTDGSEDDETINDAIKTATGIHAGVAFNIGMGDMFSIQPELLFTQKGFEFEYEQDFLGEEIKIEATQTMNYFQIPLLAKASFGGDDMKFFVNAGPSFGIFMGGKYKSKASFMGEEEEEEGDLEKEDFQTLDLGLMFGAGLGIQAGPGMFTIEGRYDYGLSGIEAEDAEEEEESDVKSKNRSLGVSISYMIPIGG